MQHRGPLVRHRLTEISGYQHFITTSDSQIALGKIRHEIPDLVLLDVMMPHVNGLEILEAMRWSEQLQCIPTLILTASSDAEMKLKALEHGAVDFLAKPVDPSELQLRVRNALIAKVHQNKLFQILYFLRNIHIKLLFALHYT